MLNAPELPGDSGDYRLLEKAVELSANAEGITIELGLRRGGGTKTIIDAIAKYCPSKVHVAIDPYGHIPYEHKEGQVVRLDYTNQMRNECLSNLFAYANQINVDVHFLQLEDTEYFKRYSDGLPVYNLEKKVCDIYSVVHFDAAHAVEPLKEQINFFKFRTSHGGCWVFDDVTGYYDHDVIEKELFDFGFKLIEKTWHKALYQL